MPRQKRNPWQKLSFFLMCLAALVLLGRFSLQRQVALYPELPHSTDVVVVGSGLAGATAALAAADYGALVVYLDLTGPQGYVLPYFSPFFWAAGTPVQEERGISYLPEDMAGQMLGEEPEDGYSGPVYAICRSSAEALSWFETHVNVPFNDLPVARDNPGLHRAENFPGLQAVQALKNRMIRQLPAVFTDWHPERLLVEENRVMGILATDDRGRSIEIRTRAVVLADGAFGGNPSLLKGFTGRQEAAIRPEGGHKGTGLLLARAAGVPAEGLSRVVYIPFRLPEGGRVLPGELVNAVLLTKEGEILPPGDITAALRQAGGNILAVKSASAGEAEPVYGGPEELAQVLGTEEELLRAALAGQRAPYSVWELGLLAMVPGGLVVDETFAVQGIDGTVAGLFAAGELVAGLPVENDFLDFYLAADVTSAYLAGRFAARFAGH